MCKELRIADIISDSIVDGVGIRMTVFTQGCPHHCEGCHNPKTHDFSGGRIITVDEILEKMNENPLLKGITLSGGEPFCQCLPLIELCKGVKAKGKDIWAYSGYTYEQLMNNATPHSAELLSLCDVLVDGRFELDKRDLTLYFRGSSNQRVIDLNKSREEEKVVLFSF